MVLVALSVGPARADETTATHAREAAAAKQHTASLNLAAPPAAAVAPVARGNGIVNGFVYSSGPQSLAFRGRLNVGKTGVYVPYYGNVDTDPLHPNAQGFAGIGYGFRSWDVSVVNGSSSSAAPAAIPGADQPKANPSLSFSIRF